MILTIYKKTCKIYIYIKRLIIRILIIYMINTAKNYIIDHNKLYII